MKKLMGVILASAVVLSLAACNSSSDPTDEPGALQKLVVVHPYATPSASSAGDALDAVGIKYGFFEEEGIEIVPQYADGSTAAVQALISGSADIGAVGLAAVINADSKGIPLSIIGANVINWPWKMATLEGSPITEPEDLRGKRIGVISLSSGSYTYTAGFLDEAGVELSEVEIIPVGTGPSAIDAISENKVDVLALYDSAYAQMELAAPGLKLAFIENPSMFDDVVSLVHTVSEDAMEEKADAFEAYLRASTKALIFAAVNPEAAALASWELNPSLLGDKSAEETLPGAAQAITAFVKSATPIGSDPSTWGSGDIGSISEENWSATNKYLLGAGLIEVPADMDSLLDLSLADAFGDFDYSEVIERAESAPREP